VLYKTGEGLFYGYTLYNGWQVPMSTDRAVALGSYLDLFPPILYDKLRRLSFGRDVPEGFNIARTIIDLEAIWLIGLRDFFRETLDAAAFEELDIGTMFHEALEGRTVPFEYHWRENLRTLPLSWKDMEEIGERVGVDYQIEAYLDGVPLDYILTEEIEVRCG
jgi:hypothetical protein